MGFRLVLILAHLSVALSSIHFNASECNNGKKCVEHPANCRSADGGFDKCDFVFAYTQTSSAPNGPIIAIDLIGRVESPQDPHYIAFGFSDDSAMGDEPVIACVFQKDGAAWPTLSRNVGKSNTGNSDTTLELVESSISDGVSHCKIRQNFGSEVDAKFRIDPKQQKVLLGAVGPAEPDNSLSYHEKREVINRSVRLADAAPKTQSAAVPLMKDEHSTPTVESFSLGLSSPTVQLFVRLHGLFMIVAWMACISLAVFSARYLRNTFGTPIKGIKLWFHVHRTLNIIAVSLIIASTIMIATAMNLKWTGPWFTKSADHNLQVGALHSLFGAVSVLFAISQPFNSLLRCAPDHPRRTIFNVFHRAIGLLGLAFALVAIFIAVFKFDQHFTSGPNLAKWVLVASVVSAIALVVVVELLAYRGVKKHVATIELKSTYNGKTRRNDSDAFSYEDSTSAETRTQKTANRLIFGAFAVTAVGSALVLSIIIQ